MFSIFKVSLKVLSFSFLYFIIFSIDGDDRGLISSIGNIEIFSLIKDWLSISVKIILVSLVSIDLLLNEKISLLIEDSKNLLLIKVCDYEFIISEIFSLDDLFNIAVNDTSSLLNESDFYNQLNFDLILSK